MTIHENYRGYEITVQAQQLSKNEEFTFAIEASITEHLDNEIKIHAVDIPESDAYQDDEIEGEKIVLRQIKNAIDRGDLPI